jgi:hypothetical protein
MNTSIRFSRRLATRQTLARRLHALRRVGDNDGSIEPDAHCRRLSSLPLSLSLKLYTLTGKHCRWMMDTPDPGVKQMRYTEPRIRYEIWTVFCLNVGSE